MLTADLSELTSSVVCSFELDRRDIAGGGIGGLTLALCLRQRGHDVDLVEQSQRFGEVGAGIELSSNGARVLNALGLAGSLARIGSTPERIVVRRLGKRP